MKLDLKTKFKNLMSMRFSKLVIFLLIVAVAAVIVLKNKTVNEKLFGKKDTVTQLTAKVKKGDIQVMVTGSGPIYFTNEKKLNSKINGTITKVNFKEGDAVKAGDVICQFDDTDFQSTLATNTNGLLQNQVSAGASYQDVSNLIIKAPFAGQVSNITVNQGDTIPKGGTVFTITDTSKLKISLTYNATDAAQISIGQSADVYLTSLMQSVSGTVTYISNQPTSTTSGGQIYTVEIDMNNPGALVSGMTASADINTSKGSVTSTNTSTLNYLNKQNVTSLTGGTVQTISVKENQRVSSNDVLVTMKNDDVIRAKQTADLKIANSQNQIASSSNQIDYYKIISPIDGVITKLSFKVGDTVKSSEQVCIVSDPTQMQFDIPIDELDVAKIQIGQKTNVTVDALPNSSTKPVIGEVSKISVQGTSVSGVTTFPVTIKINDNLDKLKGGMNANAEVMVSDNKDVLYLPIEAVTKMGDKNFVWVKGSGAKGNVPPTNGSSDFKRPSSGSTASSNTKRKSSTNTKTNTGSASSIAQSITKSVASKTTNYYENAVRKEVEVGVNNDTIIEIKSGLSEDEEVILPQTQTTSKNSTAMPGMGGSNGSSGGGFSGGGRN